MSFSPNFWFFAFIAALFAFLWALYHLRNAEKSWRHTLLAFATRQDELSVNLATRLDAESAQLWRRLITARAASNEAGQEAERARRELEDVLASLQDAVLVVDGEGRLRFLNAAALQLFEVRIADVLGAILVEALPSFGLDAAMRMALLEEQPSAREIQLYAPRIREVFLRVAPVFSGTGTGSGAVAILQDLTELRRLERVRRDFVANASHELRTPIASIRAAAETILDSPDDPALVTRFLPPMIVEAERLSRLVGDLLDLARAEDAEDLPVAPVEMSALMSTVIGRLASKAARREIELRWMLPATEIAVSGDGAALEQVIFNLLDNALTYTLPGGYVHLRVRREKQEVILEVEDSGLGIPETDLPRVFERFYRVDKARSRAEGGTGLGLAIVKHTVENHGGHVEVESELGKGTTFRVALPAL